MKTFLFPLEKNDGIQPEFVFKTVFFVRDSNKTKELTESKLNILSKNDSFVCHTANGMNKDESLNDSSCIDKFS